MDNNENKRKYSPIKRPTPKAAEKPKTNVDNEPVDKGGARYNFSSKNPEQSSQDTQKEEKTISDEELRNIFNGAKAKEKDKPSDIDGVKDIANKFSKSLENIGTILQNSVEMQNKAFKQDLDKVTQTYGKFVENSKNNIELFDDSTEEQKEVFKGLTDIFIQYRSDENADAKKFQKDLLASLTSLHAAGGNEELTKQLEAQIKSALDTVKIDPNREKYEKKWAFTDKEKDSFAYKVFGPKEKKSNISAADAAIAQGKADFIQKGLFADEKTVTDKTPTEKLLETLVKHAEASAGKSGGLSEKIEKLTISNLIVDKVGGKLGNMLERIGINRPMKRLRDDRKKSEDYAELRKKATSVEDVEFSESIRPKQRKSNRLPEIEHEDFSKLEHKKTERKIANVPEVKVKDNEKPVRKIQKLNTSETTMSKAVRSALKDVRQPISVSTKPIASAIIASKLPSAVTPEPEMKVKDTELSKIVPVEEKDDDAGQNQSSGIMGDVENIAGSVAGGALAGNLMKGVGKLGGLAKGAGKLLGKAAAPLAAGLSVYHGVDDIANGGKVDSLIPKGGILDKLNPFEYAINGGRLAGQQWDKGYEATSSLLGGRGSLGADIYSLFDKQQSHDIKFNTPQAKIVPPSKIGDLSEQAMKEKNDDQQNQQPVIVNVPPQTTTPIQSHPLPVVTGKPRDRENYFDNAMADAFTAI